jgi:hypothetical protein
LDRGLRLAFSANQAETHPRIYPAPRSMSHFKAAPDVQSTKSTPIPGRTPRMKVVPRHWLGRRAETMYTPDARLMGARGWCDDGRATAVETDRTAMREIKVLRTGMTACMCYDFKTAI